MRYSTQVAIDTILNSLVSSHVPQHRFDCISDVHSLVEHFSSKGFLYFADISGIQSVVNHTILSDARNRDFYEKSGEYSKSEKLLSDDEIIFLAAGVPIKLDFFHNIALCRCISDSVIDNLADNIIGQGLFCESGASQLNTICVDLLEYGRFTAAFKILNRLSLGNNDPFISGKTLGRVLSTSLATSKVDNIFEFIGMEKNIVGSELAEFMLDEMSLGDAVSCYRYGIEDFSKYAAIKLFPKGSHSSMWAVNEYMGSDVIDQCIDELINSGHKPNSAEYFSFLATTLFFPERALEVKCSLSFEDIAQVVKACSSHRERSLGIELIVDFMISNLSATTGESISAIDVVRRVFNVSDEASIQWYSGLIENSLKSFQNLALLSKVDLSSHIGLDGHRQEINDLILYHFSQSISSSDVGLVFSSDLLMSLIDKNNLVTAVDDIFSRVRASARDNIIKIIPDEMHMMFNGIKRHKLSIDMDI